MSYYFWSKLYESISHHLWSMLIFMSQYFWSMLIFMSQYFWSMLYYSMLHHLWFMLYVFISHNFFGPWWYSCLNILGSCCITPCCFIFGSCWYSCLIIFGPCSITPCLIIFGLCWYPSHHLWPLISYSKFSYAVWTPVPLFLGPASWRADFARRRANFVFESQKSARRRAGARNRLSL